MKKNVLPLDERIVWYNRHGVIAVNRFNELWIWEWSNRMKVYIKAFEVNNIEEGIKYLGE